MLQELLARRTVNHLPPIEHDRLARKRERKPRVLLDDNDRKFSRAHQLADDSQKLLDDDRRQPFHRLVEEQELGVGHERTCDGQHLLLAAGKLIAEILLALLELRKILIGASYVPRPRSRNDAQGLLDRERGKPEAVV